MAGTAVKDVNLIFAGMTAVQGQSANNVSQGGFREVWNSQAEKGKSDDAGQDATQTVAKKTPGDSLKARDEHLTRGAGKTQEKETAKPLEELSEEELSEVMAVLETAVADVLQQVADTFGVSVEEVQSAMEELGMEPLEALNPGRLGELFLTLGGVEDSCALVTNETLYNGYQDLLGQQKEVLQTVEEELKLDEGQLTGLLQEVQEQPFVSRTEESAPLDIRAEDFHTDQNETTQNGDDTQTPLQETVQGTEQKNAPETESRSEEGNQRQPADRGETSNLFVQNLKSAQAQPEVQQTERNASPWDVDTQDIMRQIMDYMKIQVKGDMSNVEIQLHPASLGTLQIQVASKGGVVTANFIAQNEAVKAALESQMVQLQENFEEQGIKVNAIEVTVQAHTFERNLDQGRGGSRNQEPERRNRTRRINLNDALAMEDMEQADALAADMLAAGGNTVDYTA